jgi:hypothetical protein
LYLPNDVKDAGVGECLADFCPLEPVAVLGQSVVFREAYNTNLLQFLYRLIDIHFVLFHVRFDNGLSISISRDRETCSKNLQLGNRKVKSQMSSKAPPGFFKTP